jgi:hypothetical protein
MERRRGVKSQLGPKMVCVLVVANSHHVYLSENRIRIRIRVKRWIRIRIKVMRISNSAFKSVVSNLCSRIDP